MVSPSLVSLWTLTLGPHRATASVREHALGLELRLEIDGRPWQTRVFREGAVLLATAAVGRQRLTASGWVDQDQHAQSLT